MIYRSHIFVRISLLFCLLTSTALIAKDPVARVIETETRRQADVGASLDTSLDSMAAIMEDLESNEMFTGDDVSKMKGITGILKNLKDVTLPNATKALKNAKGDNRIAKLE
ncbi:MAG: hypothetical protein HRT89_19520, partial [Lentisphaeria bacterium]|nr:hypothetical protein [Lentisphaeria bacterium]